MPQKQKHLPWKWKLPPLQSPQSLTSFSHCTFSNCLTWVYTSTAELHPHAQSPQPSPQPLSVFHSPYFSAILNYSLSHNTNCKITSPTNSTHLTNKHLPSTQLSLQTFLNCPQISNHFRESPLSLKISSHQPQPPTHQPTTSFVCLFLPILNSSLGQNTPQAPIHHLKLFLSHSPKLHQLPQLHLQLPLISLEHLLSTPQTLSFGNQPLITLFQV